MYHEQRGPHDTHRGRVDDPSADRQDGARAIEITAMFDDTVLAVRHLADPRAGKVRLSTWLLLAVAAATVIAGLAVCLRGQGGLGGLMLALGIGSGVFALTRAFTERRSPHFVLGADAKADLPLAHEALPAGCFPLVRSTGEDFELLFSSAMDGDVTVGVDRYELSSLVNDGRARPAAGYAGCYALSLPASSRTFLSFGDHSFLIASVSAPRQVAAPLLGNVSWTTQVFTGLSFAAHVALLAIVFAVPPDASALTLDTFSMHNKFVKYAAKAKLQTPEEMPAWLKRAQADDKAKQADKPGKAHRDDEGRAGRKDAPKKHKRYAMKGTADEAQLSKTLAERTARQAGLLGLLGRRPGSTMASIFGKHHALGDAALDAMGGLLGDDFGETNGVGGLGITGTMRGGGGTGEGTVGLGRLGTVGRSSDPNGRYGTGVARLRRRAPRTPKVSAGIATAKGGLDKEIIRRRVRRHINEVRYCYQRELQNTPKLGGRLVVKFTISGKGQVILSQVQSSTLSSSTVERCVTKAVRRWSFPKPAGGGIVIVSYPFSFRAAGR